MPAIIEFRNYKEFLREKLMRGDRTRLASFIGCQPPFLSQVLEGESELSLEHGLLVGQFLNLSAKETDFFMLMLQHSRAGSKKLKDYFEGKIKTVVAENQKISSRIGASNELHSHVQAQYFSSWKFSAAHILASVPKNNQKEYLQEKLKLPASQIEELLQFLVSHRILEKIGGRYRPTQRRIHLKSDNELVLSHHRNFRQRTIENLNFLKPESLHYSMLMAISEKDAEKIREVLLQSVTKTESLMEPSNEESAYLFALDFFEI